MEPGPGKTYHTIPYPLLKHELSLKDIHACEIMLVLSLTTATYMITGGHKWGACYAGAIT